MAFALIFKKLKSLTLFFVAVFKRALCCFRRRRRASDFVPLTQVGVVSNQSCEAPEDTWSDWNEQIVIPPCKPTTVQEHIEYYRQKTIAARQVQEQSEEAQENFFEDMTPRITQQTKYYLNDNEKDDGSVNRLSLNVEDVTIMGQELREWEDTSGWEEQIIDWDTREALKESRRKARQKKAWEQQQKKQEKLTRPVLGAKVSV